MGNILLAPADHRAGQPKQSLVTESTDYLVGISTQSPYADKAKRFDSSGRFDVEMGFWGRRRITAC